MCTLVLKKLNLQLISKTILNVKRKILCKKKKEERNVRISEVKNSYLSFLQNVKLKFNLPSFQEISLNC